MEDDHLYRVDTGKSTRDNTILHANTSVNFKRCSQDSKYQTCISDTCMAWYGSVVVVSVLSRWLHKKKLSSRDNTWMPLDTLLAHICCTFCYYYDCFLGMANRLTSWSLYGKERKSWLIPQVSLNENITLSYCAPCILFWTSPCPMWRGSNPWPLVKVGFVKFSWLLCNGMKIKGFSFS